MRWWRRSTVRVSPFTSSSCVGRHEEGHHRAGGAGGRLDHVGHVVLVGGLVEVLEPLARVLGVLREVVVPSVGDALELVEPPREEELHVGRCPTSSATARRRRAGAAGAGRTGMPCSMYQSWRCWHQYSYQLLALGGRHEVLHLHLLELTGAEHEVARRDLVAERLAHLRDAEGRLLARRLEHVLEVEEHALGRLRPQVHLVPGALHRPGVGLEHEVELARLGEAVLACRSSGRSSGRRACRAGSAPCSSCSRRAGR